jgi:PPOX class probable F420-dependent enzyme
MAKLTEEQQKLLTDKNFGHIATVNRDGSPQVTPVWVDYDGQHVLVNTEIRRVKPRNLKRDPRIAISIIDSANPYHYVQIRGRVVEMTTEGAAAHIDKLARKYMDVDTYPYNQPDDQRVILKIEPESAEGM